jgi:hypothetical protein
MTSTIYAPDPVWGYLPLPADPWAAPIELSPVRWFG